MFSFVIVLLFLEGVASFGASGAGGKGMTDFTCYKKAFYPTVTGGSGIHCVDMKGVAFGTVKVPKALCGSVVDTTELLEALCCANTHVVCSSDVSAPVLVSYDGSEYKIPNDASTLLQFSYERLCRMTMADKCQDCQRLDCTLFTATPAAKSCYGQTWTDKPDGSGFHNKTAAVANVGREAIFE